MFDELGSLFERVPISELPLRDPAIGSLVGPSPEGRVRIDGHDVTSMRTNGIGTRLLAAFVEQVAVIDGNGGPGTTGATGTTSRVTTRAPYPQVAPELFATYAPHARVVGGDISGTVVKDRLWYFAGLAEQTASDADDTWRSLQAIGKLVFRGDHHAAELVGIAIPSELDGKSTLASDVWGRYTVNHDRWVLGTMAGWHHESDRTGAVAKLENRAESAVGLTHVGHDHLAYLELEVVDERATGDDRSGVRTAGSVLDRWSMFSWLAIRGGVLVEHELGVTRVAPQLGFDWRPEDDDVTHVFGGWRRGITDVLIDATAPYREQAVAGIERTIAAQTTAIAYAQYDRGEATVIAVTHTWSSGFFARVAYRFAGASELRADAVYQKAFASTSVFTVGVRYRALTGSCASGTQDLDLHLALRQQRLGAHVEVFGDGFGLADPPPPASCDPDLMEQRVVLDPRLPRQPARFAQVGARISF